MPDLFAALDVEPARVEVGPGATWLRRWLAVDEQRALAVRCAAFMDGPAGGYQPVVRGGGRMSVRMTCLGRHWNAQTYTYGATRQDFDGAPVAPVPAEWIELAARLAREAGFACRPDICVINWYGAGARMGLHQDKGESASSLEAGHPVVSVSLGDAARFLFGGHRRRDAVEVLTLSSGDVLVFGGPARLRYHGVARILPGSSPLDVPATGRFNLTFRQY